MLPSMRFYIISIVSIFAALGIGIFIGFTMNTQDFIIEQNDIISGVMESQFESLISENQGLKASENELKKENIYINEYIDSSYYYMLDNRLKGLRIGIIETNDDYITSGIGKSLELAGATILNVTTIKNSILDKEGLNNILIEAHHKNPIEASVNSIAEAIITGTSNLVFDNLQKEGFITAYGRYDEPIDYVVICGGSFLEASKRINQVDRTIIEMVKKYNIPIIGVEKSGVDYSYITHYKDLGISSVDNVDMTIGKIAMVLVMEGITGNYGIKDTAESIMPKSNKILHE